MLQQEVRERLQAEDALLQAHSVLEVRVAERTAELIRTNQSLLKQIAERKMAEQALRRGEQHLRELIEDRERLAYDLHDNIVQTVYGIGMSLEESQRRLQGNPNDVSELLASAIDRLNVVIRDIRQYIAGSARKVLTGSQLSAELADMVKAIGPMAPHFRWNVDATAAERLTPNQAYNVLQIAHEALSNSLRHSQAQHGELALQVENGGTRLEISDDGLGFDPQLRPRRKDGGLQSMKSRAQRIGAELEVLSSPGQGTRIVVHIPNENGHHDIP